MKTDREFTNGFTNWMETHHEVVAYITSELDKYEDGCTIVKTMESKGKGGIYELAEDWTDEFETLHEHDDWDVDDFFDELEEFCNTKNYGNNI